MNSHGKMVVGVVGGLLVLCLCVGVASLASMWMAGGAVAQTVIRGESQVAKVAEKIADYDVPQEWDEQFALHLVGVSMVSYELQSGHGHAFLMQFPSDTVVDQAEMERQFRKTLNTHTNNGLELDLRPVGQTAAIIRGQEVSMAVSEGVSSDGDPYRQVLGFFQGNEGPAMLAFGGDIESWDQDAINGFIASLR